MAEGYEPKPPVDMLFGVINGTDYGGFNSGETKEVTIPQKGRGVFITPSFYGYASTFNWIYRSNDSQGRPVIRIKNITDGTIDSSWRLFYLVVL